MARTVRVGGDVKLSSVSALVGKQKTKRTRRLHEGQVGLQHGWRPVPSKKWLHYVTRSMLSFGVGGSVGHIGLDFVLSQVAFDELA